MTRSHFTAEDYIQWLIASPKWATMTEASRCSPKAGAHDRWRRFLLRAEGDSQTLWEEAKDQIDFTNCYLILDDTTLDKPYGPKIELVSWHWSGKHKEVVQGINLITLFWTDGKKSVPIDFRIYHKDSDGKTKNDLFCEMLKKAHERGFQPEMVLFDSWYSSLENLKLIRKLGWHFLTGIKSNRIISLSPTIYLHAGDLIPPEDGLKVHLRNFGFVHIFRTVHKDGDAKMWITSDLEKNKEDRLELIRIGFSVENYHRSLKQECCVERCQARRAHLQRVHISMAIRAFLRLEVFRFQRGLSHWETARQILRDAIRLYLQNPVYVLNVTA